MDVKQAKIAIYGAGAMGTVLGALLTKGGLSVDLITRNQAHVESLNTKGAVICCEAENTEFTQSVRAILPNQMQEKYDVIFLMTKQRENAKTVEFLLSYLQENGVICTTQNGLPEKGISEIAGTERTYGAVTTFGATFLENGKVAMTSKFQAMKMQVGGFENDESKSDLIVEILSYAGKAIENEHFAVKTDNLLGARWAKLAVNGAFSGLSVVTGEKFGVLARKSRSRKIALGIIRECIEVATACGVTLEKIQGHDAKKMLCGNSPINKLIAYMVLPFTMRRHKKLVSGMLKDVENGKKCEIDFINGVVCKLGKEKGVETPLCDKIVEITHGIENGLYETTYANVNFFEM